MSASFSGSIDITGVPPIEVDIPNPVRFGNPAGEALAAKLTEPVRFGNPAGEKLQAAADADIKVSQLVPIRLGNPPGEVLTADANIAVTKLPPIKLDPIKLDPVDLNLALTSLPSLRVHIPAAFTVALRFLGKELLSIRLHGEAQVITEPYTPNACELTTPPPPPPSLSPLPPLPDPGP